MNQKGERSSLMKDDAIRWFESCGNFCVIYIWATRS
jgi:hypothetical protein